MKLLKITKEQADDAFVNIFIQGYELHQSMYPDLFNNYITKSDYDKELENIFSSSSSVYKIINNNILVGILIAYPTIRNNLTTFFISQLVLDKQHQGKKYCTEIFKIIQIEAKKQGCQAIDLNCWAKNKHAIDVYKHLGFEELNIKFRYKLD